MAPHTSSETFPMHSPGGALHTSVNFTAIHQMAPLHRVATGATCIRRCGAVDKLFEECGLLYTKVDCAWDNSRRRVATRPPNQYRWIKASSENTHTHCHVLIRCWYNVFDVGPTANQHWRQTRIRRLKQ